MKDIQKWNTGRRKFVPFLTGILRNQEIRTNLRTFYDSNGYLEMGPTDPVSASGPILT